MNLPANFPLKKVMITVVSVVIVIALIITGVTVAVNGKAANATVDVEQVSNISTQYWGCLLYTSSGKFAGRFMLPPPFPRGYVVPQTDRREYAAHALRGLPHRDHA